MNPWGADVSVIIATHSEERWDFLGRAVASLTGQTVTPLEVIVVVDHNPVLLSRVRSELTEVIAVGNPNPQGLAGARNAGVAVARAKVIAFIDDDAEARSDWLEKLLPVYSDPRVLGVGGAIEPAWQTTRPAWLPAELDWIVGCSYVGLPTVAASVRNLIGCNMSFRREVAVGAGGFRDGIGRVGSTPLGCEETEFCIRILQRWLGHVLVYEPQARVSHRVQLNRGRWEYFVRRCYFEGLSKAQVAAAVGGRDGLSSERHYVLHTLPKAVARGLADFGLRRRPAGLKRSGVVVAGVLITTAGYSRGRLGRPRSPIDQDGSPPHAGQSPAASELSMSAHPVASLKRSGRSS